MLFKYINFNKLFSALLLPTTAVSKPVISYRLMDKF